MWILVLVVLAVVLRTSVANVEGSFRKDLYLEKYKEAIEIPIPTDGGRVHLNSAVSSCSSSLSSVMINGIECLNLSNDDDASLAYFDWCRAHSDNGRVSISFHTRNKNWTDDQDVPKFDVIVKDQNGTACLSEKDVSISKKPELEVRYVTTRSDGQEMVVHVRNDGTDDREIQRLVVNGENVDLTNRSLVQSQQTRIFVVAQRNESMKPGSVWIVSIQSDKDSIATAYGGRVVPEFFPILVWPHGSDCPETGTNEDELQALGMNAVFDDDGKCGDPSKLDTKMKLSVKLKYVDDIAKAQHLDSVASIFIGDEVDGVIEAKNLRNPDIFDAYARYPQLPTYQGAKTNGHIGTYSGLTDIQGMDAYVGACAPTIVNVLKALPITYSYDYLKVTRENHSPLPTWLYSQLYSDAWSYQANANELFVQIMYTVMAGGKGVTLFQSYQKEFEEHDMKTLKKALLPIKSLDEYFRQGSVDGAQIEVKSDHNQLTQVVRTPDKLIVMVVNLEASGYSNLLCHTFIDKHWTFKSASIDKITVTVPSDLKISNPTEQVGDDIVTSIQDADIELKSDNVVELKNVKLDDKVAGRFFVFDV